MDRKTWGFVLAGLAIAIGLAALVSPLASLSPDGLDKFAQEQQFAERAENKDVWTHAPLAEYKLRGVTNASLATSLAGVIGTVLVFGCAFGLARVLRRKDRSES